MDHGILLSKWGPDLARQRKGSSGCAKGQELQGAAWFPHTGGLFTEVGSHEAAHTERMSWLTQGELCTVLYVTGKDQDPLPPCGLAQDSASQTFLISSSKRNLGHLTCKSWAMDRAGILYKGQGSSYSESYKICMQVSHLAVTAVHKNSPCLSRDEPGLLSNNLEICSLSDLRSQAKLCFLSNMSYKAECSISLWTSWLLDAQEWKPIPNRWNPEVSKKELCTTEKG